MTKGRVNPAATLTTRTDATEQKMNHPTEPIGRPEGAPGGHSAGHPPAGYFTNPTLAQDPARDSSQEGGAETAQIHKPAADSRAVRHPVRVGTVVWGAVVLAAGILIIMTSQLGLNLNPGLTAMWLLLGAGVAMVAGGAVNLARRRRP